MTADHILQFNHEDEERPYWECSCGISGSAPAHLVDVAAERHIKPGESVVYRTILER